MSQPKRYRRRRSKRERLVLVLAILLFAGAGIYGAVRCFVRPPEVDEQEDPSQVHEHDPGTSGQDGTDASQEKVFTRRDNCFTILVSGQDDANGGSDTNILVMLDTQKGEINAVSLPRDTLIHTDWNVPKLNASYNVGGVERLQEEISNLLGIPVDFYISVNLEGFVELVDAIGGVNFDVPINMNYDDPTQDLHIHFSKGLQYLNGEDALKVVRWRQNNDNTGYANGDLGRIETQQAFLTTIAKQMLSSISLSSIQTYADLFMKYVETDLTVGNLVWVGEQALGMGMENIHFYTLPGDGATLEGLGFYKGSYYVLDPQQVLELVNTSFNPYAEDLTLEDMDILAPET